MNKLFKSSLLLALFAAAPFLSFASSTSSPFPSLIVQKETVKIMQFVNAFQSNPGQIASNWGSTWGGNFTVYLLDLTTNTAAGPFVTPNTFMLFNGLISGHIYRVSVHDDITVMASPAVLLK